MIELRTNTEIRDEKKSMIWKVKIFREKIKEKNITNNE
jgi:hypothetical protein